MPRSIGRSTKQRWLVLGFVLMSAVGAIVFVRQSTNKQAERHMNAGIDFIRKGQPIEAEAEWIEATRSTPQNPLLWDLLSELYINTQQWEKGFDALQHLLKIDPNRPYLYSRMGVCVLRMGNEREAQTLALEELKHNPDDEASLTLLAFLAGMQDNTDAQVDYLKRFLIRHPDDIETLYTLAEAYNSVGKYPEMLPVVNHLIPLQPHGGSAYAMRAAARYETDASPVSNLQCEADLLKALQYDPLSAFARYNLGRLYFREKRYAKAIFQLETAQKLSPLKMDVPFTLATAYARNGLSVKADVARQRFEALRKKSTDASVLQKKCALNHKDFEAHLQMGKLMLENGTYRKAMYYLQHALVLNPQSTEAKASYKELSAQLNAQQATPAP